MGWPHRRPSTALSLLICPAITMALWGCAPEPTGTDRRPVPPPATSRVSCSERCIIVEDSRPLVTAMARPDSIGSLSLLAKFQVSGHAGGILVLSNRSDDSLRQLAGTAALVIDVEGVSTEFPLRDLSHSINIFAFSRDQTINVRYWLRRGVLRNGPADWRLEQIATGAVVGSAFTPWHRPAGIARMMSLDSSCYVTSATGTCSDVNWSASPFAATGWFVANSFQSGGGQGPSSPITITFSKPIPRAKIIIQDPTFSGNTAVAYDSTNTQVASGSFASSGTPGVNQPDSLTLTGNIRSIVLTPAANDYVTYQLLLLPVAKPRVVITFDTVTPRDGAGRPIVLPTAINVIGEPVPQINGGNWPNVLTFTVTLDSAGKSVRNQMITLSVVAVDSAGRASDSDFGHFHYGEIGGAAKPKGKLSATSISTDTGAATVKVTYTSGPISGPIRLMGVRASADTARATIIVGVPSLVPLDSSMQVRWIGRTSRHPSNHWGTPTMVSMLTNVAGALYSRYNRSLPVNDMSLRWGGRFDIDTTQLWSRRKHVEHAVGRSADIRITGDGIIDPAQRVFLWDAWEALGGTVHPETSPVHWHFRYWGTTP